MDTQKNTKSAPADRALRGPFDVSELIGIKPFIDLGSIRIEPREGLQMRLDVDQTKKRVVAISLDFEESTLQLQAFAAPKKRGLWLEVLERITAQLQAQDAKMLNREGPFGPEVIAQFMVNTENGPQKNTVRFIGVDGPRWILRGAITGKALVDQSVSEALEEIFKSTVIVRGDHPLPPNELLPLKVPGAAGSK